MRGGGLVWYYVIMNIAVILLAGKGERLNKETPKQFIEIKGKPLFFYSLETFINHPLIDSIILVTSSKYLNDVKASVFNKSKKIKDVILGGKTRQESVFNSLQYLFDNSVSDNDNILIHDSARPFVSNKVISDCVKSLENNKAVVTSIRMADTVSICQNNYVFDMFDRDLLYIHQTPQAFKFDLIYKAHKEALKNEMYDKSDDVFLVKNLGEKVLYIDGERSNFKITNEEDLTLMLKLLD